MKLQLSSATVPVLLSLDGNIDQIGFNWRVKPVISSLRNQDIENLYYHLYRLKKWAAEKRIQMNLKASFLFRSAFYFFCKSSDYEEHN
jgi:hypothetical protein